MGKQWKPWQALVSLAPKSLQMVTAAMQLKDTPWKESYDQLRQHISLIVQLVKKLHVMRKTWVQSLGWDDPLEKGNATDSSILALSIPWTV